MTDSRTVPRVYDLKCWPDFFAPILSGEKTFELRKDDRGYRAGDTLLLREWLPTDKVYTGRKVYRSVSYLVAGMPWLQKDYVCMALAPAAPAPAAGDERMREILAEQHRTRTLGDSTPAPAAGEVEALLESSLAADLAAARELITEVPQIMRRQQQAEERARALRTALQNARNAYDYEECLQFIDAALAEPGGGTPTDKAAP